MKIRNFLIAILSFGVFCLNAQDLDWQKLAENTGGDCVPAVQKTNDGGFVIAGYLGSEVTQTTNDKASHDFWVVKLDSDGNLVWRKIHKTRSLEEDRQVSQPVYEAPVEVVTPEPEKGENKAIEPPAEVEFLVYPNPADRHLNIETAEEIKYGKIFITALDGQVFYSETFNSIRKKTIDVSSFPYGVYKLGLNAVKNGRPVEFSKMIIVK